MNWRTFLAEFVGTAALLAGVVGSGIMAERLSPGDVGLQLLQNAIATAAVLVALILALQEASRRTASSGKLFRSQEAAAIGKPSRA